MADRVASVTLIARIQGYIGPVQAARRATADLSAELQKAAKAGKLDQLATTATRAGLALVGGFAAVNFAAMRFEKQMSAVASVSNANAAQMALLGKAALKAGKDTAFSATEAARAEEELAKAGISTADILGGALTGALDLAAAGGLELTEAAEVGAKAMNVFGLEGKDMSHIADVLAAGASKSATDVHELGFALKMGGLAAKMSGISLEETVGTLSLFADNALSGSDAGTSFKSMMLQLASPSEKAATLMEELGINAYDAGGNFIGLAGLADVLKNRLAGLTQQQRTAALATIFGTDAVRAASILYDAGGDAVRHYTQEVDDSGAAQRMAGERMNNLAGDVERLKGSLETLAIQSGSGTNQGLRFLAKGAESVVNQIGALPAPVLTATTVLAGLTGGSLLALGGFLKLRQKSQEVQEALSAMGPSGERAARGVGKLGSALAKAGAAFAVFEVAGAIGTAVIKDLNPQLDAAAVGLQTWTGKAKLSGEAARIFGEDAEELNRALASAAAGGFSSFMDDITASVPFAGREIQRARERVEAFDQSLAAMVQAGNGEQAFLLLEEMARRAGVSVDQLRGSLPAYTGAVEVAGDKTKQTATATKTADQRMAELAETMGFATEEGETLIDMWKRLNGQLLSADEKALDANKAIEDLGETFKDNGPKIKGNTTKVLENRVAMENAAEKAVEAAQAYLDNGGSAEGAAAKLRHYKEDAIKATGATGAAKQAVKEFADKLFALPKTAAPKVSAPGAVQSKWEVFGLQQALGKLPKSKRAPVHTPGAVQSRWDVLALQQSIDRLHGKTVYVNTRHRDIPQRWGGVTEHAQMGLLRQASMFSAGPTRYAFAEPATGGEAFIPRRGDYGRSMAILDTAASWYGADVMPRVAARGGGGGGVVTNVTYQVNVGVAPGGDLQAAGKYMAEALKRYEQSNGRRWRTP